ncbi:DNA polymerase III subunit epsilon [Gammaproteobacteria bacterium]
MRQIILDTETTGLEPGAGHRIIEIGCIELIDRRLTKQRWHNYLNPDRKIDAGAAAVHGITNDFLKNKPRFSDIVEDLINFIRGSELIIHNAPFDVGFINNELRLAGSQWGRVEDICRVTDTLVLARGLYPGQKNSLDALCKRHGIDNSHRNLHGALLDAEILVEVYLAMTGGQVSLSLGGNVEPVRASSLTPLRISGNRPKLPITALTSEEEVAHQKKLDDIDKASNGNCVWRHMDAAVTFGVHA